jgi:hypothetical protein
MGKNAYRACDERPARSLYTPAEVRIEVFCLCLILVEVVLMFVGFAVWVQPAIDAIRG